MSVDRQGPVRCQVAGPVAAHRMGVIRPVAGDAMDDVSMSVSCQLPGSSVSSGDHCQTMFPKFVFGSHASGPLTPHVGWMGRRPGRSQGAEMTRESGRC